MFNCNLDGSLFWQKETDGLPAGVGLKVGGGVIKVAEISSEVPEGERDEWACKFAAVDDLIAAIEAIDPSKTGYAQSMDWVEYNKAIKKCRDAKLKARGEL